MQSQIKNLPYDEMLSFVDRMKKEFFLRKWPEDAPSIVIDASHYKIEHYLRYENHWEGMYLSYEYEGQILDLRKPAGTIKKIPMEYHVRTRDAENGAEMIGHFEASRYEEKRRHINEIGFTLLDEEDLAELMEDSGFDIM